MAMLAEPRQRKRYNLVPKGKALYEDDSRFGTKMLERMGWKKGEGLGANSEGSKDFVRIRYKNDAFGLGFEQRDDQWTQHEQSFNGLLKTLNNEENEENVNNVNNELADEIPSRVGFGFQESVTEEKTKSKGQKMKEKISGISLEERSKQSKARVHYKKFTRGKDLAQYSEKDLANIFGKKAVDEQQAANDLYSQLNNTFGIITENTGNLETAAESVADSEEVQNKKKDKKKKKKDLVKEEEAGSELQDEQQQKLKPQTFNSNLSVQDYFKMKMEAIRNKKAGLNNETEIIKVCEEPELELLKKKKKSKKGVKDQEPIEEETKKSPCNTITEDLVSNEIEKDDIPDKKLKVAEAAELNLDKSKSKKKKNKEKYEVQTDSTNEVSLEKKRKLETLPDETPEAAESVEHVLEVDFKHEPIKKKKKKNKKELKEIDEIICIDEDDKGEFENQTTAEEKKKKKKSKRNKEPIEETSSDPAKKLKEDASSTAKNTDENDIEKAGLNNKTKTIEVCEEPELELPKKKKKSKKGVKDQESIVEETKKSPCNSITEGLCSNEIEKDDILEKRSNIEEAAESNLNENKSKKKKNKEKYQIQTDSTNEVPLKKKRKLENVPAETSTAAEAVETVLEIDLTQEPIKKKKKKNKKELKEMDKIIVINDDVKDETDLTENQLIVEEKEKNDNSEKMKETTEETLLDSTNELKQAPNPSAKSIDEDDINFEVLSLEELKEKHESLNVFPISGFCAEKFRNINVDRFEGSSLLQVEGYGFNSDTKLEVCRNKFDDDRISNLWKLSINKYDPTDQPKKAYADYFGKAIEARNRKEKTPKAPVKYLKRKSLFQLV